MLEATINYLSPMDEKPTYFLEPPAGMPEENMGYERGSPCRFAMLVYLNHLHRLSVRVWGCRSSDSGDQPLRSERYPRYLLCGGRKSDEAGALLQRRFGIINVWKPIRGPVRQVPLAICDSRTIAPGELVETDLVFADRTGEVSMLTYNPDHRWYYVPEMRADEAVLLKCYDSEHNRSRFTAHTAFDDPNSDAKAPPRESIEIRTLVFF